MKTEIKKQSILIVDDMPINIQVLAGTLKTAYPLKIATNGKKALEIALSEDPPDLILLDIMMPEMDGYEVIRQLKRNNRTKSIPVIFITAMAEVEDETKGLAMGAVDYIVKPFQLPIVKARIKTHLALKYKSDLLEKLASVDGLTGIPNRRMFDEVLEKEWRRAMRESGPLSLVMIDIDYFKPYNDNYGHASGDECLSRVARALHESLNRAADLICRYGGEEFAAILPGTDAEGAAAIAEKIRLNIEALNIPHCRSDAADHITISLGAATVIPSAEYSIKDLIEHADKMLYEAKDKGRNRVAA